MKDLAARILDLAVRIQQIPAPTFDEKRRADFVRGLFNQEHLSDVSSDGINNVYGRLPGSHNASPLIVSAHLDTVFAANVSHDVFREPHRIQGAGLGDNSLGVAALLGLLWMLRKQKLELPGDLWLIANVGEEGLGDLRGMKAVVNRFGRAPRAYLVLEGTALGHVYHRAVGVRRYRIRVHTAGGHSWSDYGQPSAIHEAALLVTRLTALSVPSVPRTTLNVGLISGGTGVNVLAAEASFDLDVRSEKVETLDTLAAQVEEAIQSARRDGVEIEVQVIGQRPAGEIPLDHPLVRLAGECIAELGLSATYTAGSTDANIPLSLGYPAVVLGITTGGGAHTVHEYIDAEPVEKGMQQLLRFTQRVFTL
jgi:tripeptide aminopeptidase